MLLCHGNVSIGCGHPDTTSPGPLSGPLQGEKNAVLATASGTSNSLMGHALVSFQE